MGDDSKIEWTDATWNPVRGCTKVSAGCKHCYAETFAERWRGVPGHPFEQGFDLRLVPEALDLPLRWKRPRRIFVNSMSDLFHEDVPSEFIDQVFGVMASARHHTFQVLTKRADRMRVFLERCAPDRGGFPNVWLGVSVEDQAAANERVPELLATPAAVRFLSCEPLLGPVDLTGSCRPWGAGGASAAMLSAIHWVIAGGESGPRARPMHPAWARSLRDQCQGAGVPFFFKQWGEWAPFMDDEKFTRGGAETDRNAQTWMRANGELGLCWIYDDDGNWQNCTGEPGPEREGVASDVAILNRWGKKAAGRELDGRTWDEMPGASR